MVSDVPCRFSGLTPRLPGLGFARAALSRSAAHRPLSPGPLLRKPVRVHALAAQDAFYRVDTNLRFEVVTLIGIRNRILTKQPGYPCRVLSASRPSRLDGVPRTRYPPSFPLHAEAHLRPEDEKTSLPDICNQLVVTGTQTIHKLSTGRLTLSQPSLPLRPFHPHACTSFVATSSTRAPANRKRYHRLRVVARFGAAQPAVTITVRPTPMRSRPPQSGL